MSAPEEPQAFRLSGKLLTEVLDKHRRALKRSDLWPEGSYASALEEFETDHDVPCLVVTTVYAGAAAVSAAKNQWAAQMLDLDAE